MYKRVFDKDEINGWGGSNTPLTTKNTSLNRYEKRVLIDWLSVTFDWVTVDSDFGRYIIDINNPDLMQLIRILNDGREVISHQIGKANGYQLSLVVGEHIKLLYGSELTRTAEGKYTVNLVMSGQACREFESFNKGSWQELFSFLLTKGIVNLNRLDIAIDDFDGAEIDIYDIAPFIRSGHYVSPLSKFQIIESGRKLSSAEELSYSEGFTITLGSAGSTQLQIYDKRLERDVKNQPDLNTPLWYRYEMRFVKEKALHVMKLYLLNVQNNDSESFMRYARELMFSMLDLKVVNENKSNLSMCDTYHKWSDFLDAVEKIDIRVKHEINTSLEKTKEWYDRSIKGSNLDLFMSMGENDYLNFIYEGMIAAYEKYDERKLARLNNKRKKSGLAPYTWEDIRKQIKIIEEKLKEGDDMPF